MAETDPLGDIFTMFAAPIAGTIRSVEQFRTGVDQFLEGVENFNRTMANLNETTERINSLLAEVEEPLRASIPQWTRSVRAADEMMQAVSGPAMAAAPAFTQIADAMATPAFQQLPARVAQFNEMMAEVSRRLGPLSQFAESAGGLFGGFRFPGMPGTGTINRPVGADDELDEAVEELVEVTDDLVEGDDEDPRSRPRQQRPAKKPAATRRSAAKTSGAKTSGAKTSGAKTSAAKTSTAKKQPAAEKSVD